MKKCPNCNHKLYEGVNKIKYCKHCGYTNNPNHGKKYGQKIKLNPEVLELE